MRSILRPGSCGSSSRVRVIEDGLTVVFSRLVLVLVETKVAMFNQVSKGWVYLEDRRPSANADPYLVSARVLQSAYSNGRAEERQSPEPSLAFAQGVNQQ
jgi:hypothetical protein